MLAYTLIVARPGGPVPAATLTAVRERCPRELPFQPRHELTWTSESGSVVFAAWQDALDEPGVGSRWHRSEGRVTAFTGLAWPRERRWAADRAWAPQLAEHLSANPSEQGADELLGAFTAVSLGATGEGVVATDPLGVGLVYAGEGRHVWVLSNRANLAAIALAGEGESPARDTLGACWLAYSPYPIGSRTGFEGIELIRGTAIQVDPSHGLRITRTVRPWHEPARGRDRRDMIDELRADIAASIRAARALPVRDHLADLTGGKDSRLVLAVMLDEGLAEDFEFRTIGARDLPDVLIAKRIAQEFSLRHSATVFDPWPRGWRETYQRAVSDAGYETVPPRELTLRANVGSWFGARSAFEPRAAWPPDGESVLLSGAGGGILRGTLRSPPRLRSMAAVEGFPPSQLGFGVAGILRPEAEDHYARTVRHALVEDLGELDAPQDAFDAFYIRNRLRRWLGTSCEVDRQNRVFALHSIAGVRAAFAIGPEERHAERLHFEAVRAACPPLAAIPFDRGGWDPRLDGGGADPNVGPASAPAGTAGAAARGAGGTGRRPELEHRSAQGPRHRRVLAEWRGRHAATDVEIMRDHLLGDPSNPVFEVLDREAVAAAVERFGELRERARRQLYGALTAAIWLGGNEITLRPGGASEAPR